MDKMPPFEKIYEAYTALADNRLEFVKSDDEAGTVGQAFVTSSDGSKRYKVTWRGDTYASTDSASYWQGYPGYPVIAVLMHEGRVPYDGTVGMKLAGIPWKSLNEAHKRDYAGAAAEAFEKLDLSEAERDDIVRTAKLAYEALGDLDIVIKRKV